MSTAGSHAVACSSPTTRVLECNTSTAVNGIATTAIADPAVLIVSPNQNHRKSRSRHSPDPTIPSLPRAAKIGLGFVLERAKGTGDARGADGTVWGNVNTGNNQYGRGGPRPQADDPSGNYPDTERTFQQGMRELNQLRQMVKGDPEAAKEAEELARKMQHLDPTRFPGNPAIVEQMHQEVLSSIDRLELAVERTSAATLASRTGKPQAVPEGYQDSVAEYYRQLSKSQ